MAVINATKQVVDSLSLISKYSETMLIRTYGSQLEVCDVALLGIVLKDWQSLQLSFLTVPFMCEPLIN